MFQRAPWLLRLEPAISQVIDVAERYADGAATEEERIAALRSTAKWDYKGDFFSPARSALDKNAYTAARAVVANVAAVVSHLGYDSETADLLRQAQTAIAAAVREIFGPRRALVAFSPKWRTDTAVALARQMNDSQDWSALAILADALQDGGCDNDSVLNACRVDTTPARASWAVDMVLNPTLTFAPEWRTDAAVSLAQRMYEARDFSALPTLASALQDAGCDNAVVLDHCRVPGAHVRGCWVVDWVLGMD